MHYATTVYDVSVEFERSQAPPYKSSGGVRRVKDPLEGVVLSVYCKTVLIEVREREKY